MQVKFSLVCNILKYTRRFIGALRDLKFEVYNVTSGLITWKDFFRQIIPTFKYHLSGEFDKKIDELMKETHIGI